MIKELAVSLVIWSAESGPKPGHRALQGDHEGAASVPEITNMFSDPDIFVVSDLQSRLAS